MDMPAELKEFALASVSVADSLGIMFADVMSLYIQSCIYKMNNVEGAVVGCPYWVVVWAQNFDETRPMTAVGKALACRSGSGLA